MTDGTPSSLGLTLSTGELAEAVRLDGERLHLVSPRAYAPGAPVRSELEVGGSVITLEGKTLGSKRRADGRFDVVLRLVNLTRPAREALVDAFTGNPASA